MSYYIRYANTNDSKALGYIHSQSWEIAYKTIIPDSILNNMSAEKREEYFRKALAENLEEDSLIFKENDAVGFMTLGKCRDKDLDNSWGEIWEIYLLPSYWKQGIGTKLIEWGINQLKNRGFKKLSLWVLEENINARKFYEKMGFYHDGTVKKLNECRYIKSI